MWRQVVSHDESTIRGNSMKMGSSGSPGDLLRNFVRRGASFSGRERNCCFLNTAGQQFADISAISGTDFPDDARAIALSDWDHDGDVDLWLVNRSGPQVRFLRNDAPNENHFVSLKLIGKDCNRDAIGARVEVVLNKSRPLIKTLRAGDGFLSQSSKWIHVGLGDATHIERLVVRWPGTGAQPETFTDIEVDAQYELAQGSGRLRRWKRAEAVRFERTATVASSASGSRRTYFANPIPMPRLPFETQDGKMTSIVESPGRPLLVHLWASWCQPCLAELHDLSKRKHQLDDAEVDVVSLSVDLLGDSPTESRRVALQALKRVGFPHPAGFASVELVDNLQLVHDELFDHHHALPVPTSLLVDRQGQMAALYKGRLDVDQVLADVALQEGDQRARRNAATSFAGKWYGPLNKQRPVVIAYKLLEERKLATAQNYLERHESVFSRDALFPATLVNLGIELLEAEKPEEAEKQFRRAVVLDPKLPAARYNLGLMAEQRGDDDVAVGHYRDVVKIAPDGAPPRLRLAMLLLKSRRNEAIEHLKQLVTISPDFAPGHYQLAEIYRGENRFEKAAVHYRQATEIDPRDTMSRFRLGLTLYQRGKQSEGIEHLRHAQRLAPQNVQVQNSLAWVLATSADPHLRDGKEALRLAKQMCERTEFGVAGLLDTLAAAYAATGGFESAIETAEKSQRLARSNNQSALARRIENRLQRYRVGRAVVVP